MAMEIDGVHVRTTGRLAMRRTGGSGMQLCCYHTGESRTWRGCGRRGRVCSGEERTWCGRCGKVWRFPQKLQTEPASDSPAPPLGVPREETKPFSRRDTRLSGSGQPCSQRPGPEATRGLVPVQNGEGREGSHPWWRRLTTALEHPPLLVSEGSS